MWLDDAQSEKRKTVSGIPSIDPRRNAGSMEGDGERAASNLYD